MHMIGPGDRLNGVQGVHDAQGTVILHAQIPVFGLWVEPRDHEHTKPLPGQKFDHRIFGRQIENIIFHDPGGDDQDRFWMDLIRRGRILDQLDQAIAIDHLTGAGGQIAAKLKGLKVGRFFFGHIAFDVFAKIARPAYKVHAPLRQRRLQDFGIGQRQV